MSIFFDFDVGASGRRFRRAVNGDKCDIELLLDGSEKDLFGSVDIGSLIELSTLPICMINAKLEVVGFVALADHPNVDGVLPGHWEWWMRNLYQKFYLSRNTLFIHAMCCNAEVQPFFLEEAMVSVFRSDSYLSQVLLMVPTTCPKDFFLNYEAFKKHQFTKISAPMHDDVPTSYFYAALRRDFCPKLKIRRAVEEDNDDIIEFLDKKCPRLRQLYGDYYISELVGRHPEMKREVIVADCQSVAVGVMCLNADINYEMLQRTYELGPYHDLKKTTPIEKETGKRNNNLLRTFGDPIMLGHWSPFQRFPKAEAASVDDEPSKENLVEVNPPKTPSRVNFDRESMRLLDMRQSSDEFSEKSVYDRLSVYDWRLFSRSDHSVVALLDEEPLEYEIVNIDSNLLTVPDAFSSDTLYHPGSQGSRRSRHNSNISQIQRNVKRRVSTYAPKVSPPEPVHESYQGEPDAFMIELFGFREDIDERHGYDLLEAAFEVMKQYDYCIIRVPCVDKSFSLLQHFCFVPYKPNVCSKYALYVAHRNSVAGKLRVRRAELFDIPQIALLMQSLDGKHTLWTVEDTILHRNTLQAYVLMSGVSLVGVGILEPPEHTDFVRAKFNLDSYLIHHYHTGFITLKAALVYPVFEPHFRFFIRDMMRHADVTSVLWLTAYRNKWVIHKINTLALAMIPLLPRKFELEYEEIEDLKTLTQLSNSLKSFSAWYMNSSLSSVPRVNVDTRIVVVGASRTGISFINKLLFQDSPSYLLFTSVTLICRRGLPYSRRCNTEGMFLRRQTTADRYLKSVPYTYYINVIQGTMVEINKKEKYIKLANDSKCYYDLLFLMIGKQYQHPGYLRSALDRERSLKRGTFQYTPLDRPEHREVVGNPEVPPDNVFIINCPADAGRALRYIGGLRSRGTDSKIIVYGASIHAYCCLATLLESRAPDDDIVFVEPFPPSNPAKTRVSLFCNDYVDNMFLKMLSRLQVTVHRAYYFHTWTVDATNIATQVEFLSDTKLLRLECDAFFYYGKRSVDEQALIAINKSGMTYDGGIVIDHEFRTRDPWIYAAGSATKYNRRYCADNKRHKYYDSAEVGETVTKIIVYGASIHAYCCLATLLESRAPDDDIVFVEPFPPSNPAKTRVSLFCNDYVDNMFLKMLSRLQVTVHRAYYFHTWTVDATNIATQVEFLSDTKLLRLECDAFFYYGKRSVDEQALIAINKSGMTYDGGIVIDHEFRTRDPWIYAAGSATKYNRRYCADNKRHKYYDSAEVGETLGAQIRNKLDPLFTEVKVTPRKSSVRFSFKDSNPDSSDLEVKDPFCQEDESVNRKSFTENPSSQLPQFTKPRVTNCTLPGGLQYLEVRPPAMKTPHHYVQSLHYTGYVLETFKTGYFKLHLTNDLVVDGVTCLTPEKYSLEIFKRLYGLSAVVLNNVHLRYAAKKLDDFFEFFRSPWAVFLYHDQRDELFAMVKELLPKARIFSTKYNI